MTTSSTRRRIACASLITLAAIAIVPLKAHSVVPASAASKLSAHLAATNTGFNPRDTIPSPSQPGPYFSPPAPMNFSTTNIALNTVVNNVPLNLGVSVGGDILGGATDAVKIVVDSAGDLSAINAAGGLATRGTLTIPATLGSGLFIIDPNSGAKVPLTEANLPNVYSVLTSLLGSPDVQTNLAALQPGIYSYLFSGGAVSQASLAHLVGFNADGSVYFSVALLNVLHVMVVGSVAS